MVPLPTAADDHQRKNAEALEKAGASRMILQSKLADGWLAMQIHNLIERPELIRDMEKNAKKLARSDAAEATVDLIEGMVRN